MYMDIYTYNYVFKYICIYLVCVRVYTQTHTHTLVRSDEQIHKHTGTHVYVCMPPQHTAMLVRHSFICTETIF